MDSMKREELEKACKKIRKVRTRMVMMWVIDTADTAPSQRAEGCKPTQVCPDCVAFLGSTVPERPSCIVPAAARYRQAASIHEGSKSGYTAAWTVSFNPEFLWGMHADGPARHAGG